MPLVPPDLATRPPPANLRDHIVRTLILAVPVIVARCGLLIMVTVDTIMTGQAGGQELAYLGIAFAPHLTMLVIGIGLLSGTVILVSQADGAGRIRDCGRVLWIALFDAAVMGLLWAALLFEGERLLLLTGQDPYLARGGGHALTMFAWGMPAIYLFTAASMFLEGIGRVKPGMIIMLLANVANAGLNWVLIYGHLGFEPGGAAGAVLATSITRWLMFGCILGYILLMADRHAYGVLAPLRGFWMLQRRFLRLGVPMSLSYAFETTAFLSITIMAGWLGATQVAAYQASLNVVAFCFMIAIGMSTATSVRVGNAIGRRDRTGMAMAGWTGTGLILTAMIPLAIIVALFPQTLAGIYTSDAEVAALIVATLTVAALLIPGDGLQGVLLGALRGAADVWPTTALGFLSFWIIMVPSAWYLGHQAGLGLPGLLWAQLIGLSAAALFFGLRFLVISRRDIRPFA
ncbi:MAG: MATE family efflux transporter [Rhodospirillales bacterium]|nr:MATE family efflux transporter [Rhodospirillales bacterium]